MLDKVGLADRADDVAKSLPYGARRALEIAVALACRPKLLFLDEPTAGLGSDGRARLAELVRKLKGMLTIVIIEHDMEFLFSLADEISVIHWGQVIARGTPAELQGQPLGRSLQPGAAQLMLDVAAIDTFYGETQALFGVSLSVRRRRGAGAARRQRRGQDHGAALDPRPDAARGAATSASRASRSRPSRRTRSPAPASAGCRTTAACARR